MPLFPRTGLIAGDFTATAFKFNIIDSSGINPAATNVINVALPAAASVVNGGWTAIAMNYGPLTLSGDPPGSITVNIIPAGDDTIDGQFPWTNASPLFYSVTSTTSPMPDFIGISLLLVSDGVSDWQPLPIDPFGSNLSEGVTPPPP